MVSEKLGIRNRKLELGKLEQLQTFWSSVFLDKAPHNQLLVSTSMNEWLRLLERFFGTGVYKNPLRNDIFVQLKKWHICKVGKILKKIHAHCFLLETFRCDFSENNRTHLGENASAHIHVGCKWSYDFTNIYMGNFQLKIFVRVLFVFFSWILKHTITFFFLIYKMWVY